MSPQQRSSRGAEPRPSFSRHHGRKLLVGWKRFTPATFSGSLPGTVSFVLLGSSVSMDASAGTMALDPWALLASAAVFAGSIATSRYLKRCEGKKEDDGQQRGA